MLELDSLDRIDAATFDYPEVLSRPAMLFSGQLTEVYAEAAGDRAEIHLGYHRETPDELQPSLDQFNSDLASNWMKLIVDAASREVDAAKQAFEHTRETHSAKIRALRAGYQREVA